MLPKWPTGQGQEEEMPPRNDSLAQKLLEHLQAAGGDEQGVIEFPREWQGFKYGKLEHAVQALAWNAIWHEDLIDMDEKSFFWVGAEVDKSYGYREKRESQTLHDVGGVGDDNGAVYHGEWLVGTDTRQGLGGLTRKDGTSYYGYFKNNRFEGKGKLKYVDDDLAGRRYHAGLFVQGRLHGLGTVVMRNGDQYKGKWVRNQLIGQGVYIYQNGIRTRFYSEPNKEMVLDARLIYPDEDYRLEYRGETDGCRMHGRGTLTLKDGKAFTGDWVYDVSKDQQAELIFCEKKWQLAKE